MRWCAAIGGLVLAACGVPAAAQEAGPLAIYGNKQTFEIAPVLLAARGYDSSQVTVTMGGVGNLVGERPVAGFGEPGEADLATNAETQLLRFSVQHPDLRIVLCVSEGLYRIVARRSAGIASIADLKGKRVATIAQTSSGYFLDRMLRRAGLTFDDIEARPIVPLSGMTEALRKGEVDAVVIWEPESEKSAHVLGDDVIEFDGKGVYRELFNLNTTAEKLADPQMRIRIVRFVRSVIDARAAIARDPVEAKRLVAGASGFTPQEVEAGWAQHNFAPAFPDDMLDVLVEEEQWLAARDNRAPRSPAELAGLIDTSIYRDALALVDVE